MKPMRNIFKYIPANLQDEIVETLTESSRLTGFRVERIISRGQASPPGFWYDQDYNELVLLLKGKAGLLIKNENKLYEMTPGDFLDIPAHNLHRVEWTSPDEDTIWLAVHY